MMILRSAGWHISPDDLLHIVLAVKVCRRSHIAMAPLAIFRADDGRVILNVGDSPNPSPPVSGGRIK